MVRLLTYPSNRDGIIIGLSMTSITLCRLDILVPCLLVYTVSQTLRVIDDPYYY